MRFPTAVISITLVIMHHKVFGAVVPRQKRFILDDDSATDFPFPVPTTYPIPTVRKDPLLHITPPTKTSRGPQTITLNPAPGIGLSGAIADFTVQEVLANAVQVTCPVKRSADATRVLLNDNLMEELYSTLVGQLDTRYMARTRSEAEKHFQHRLPTFQKKDHHVTKHQLTTKASVIEDYRRLKKWYHTVVRNMNTTVHNGSKARFQAATEQQRASFQHETLKYLLSYLDITVDNVKHLLGLSNDVNDVLNFTTDVHRRSRRAASGSVTHVEYCHDRGAATGNGFLHMCSMCALTTQLPDDKFPRFINEADCDTSDCDCFTVTGTAHGKCQPIIRPVKMLRRKAGGCRVLIKNGQQIIVDDWELYDQPMKTGCECVFNKNSMFATFIPR